MTAPGTLTAARFWTPEPPGPDRTPLPKRPLLEWPNGAKLAMVFVVSAEYFEMSPPDDAWVPANVPGGFGRAPYPDFRAYSYREYGNRIGIFRVIDAFDRVGLRATLAVDAMTASTRGIIVDRCVQRGWEVAAHGVAATRAISSRMTEDAEARYIDQSIAAIRDATGRQPRGWHGIEYGQSARTPAMLAARGVRYCLDWPNDEQPYRVSTAAGELIALPMPVDLDDVFCHWHRKLSMRTWHDSILEAANQLRSSKEGAGRVLVVNLHPWLVGQASRIAWLESLLDRLGEIECLWHATAEEVVDAFAGG